MTVSYRSLATIPLTLTTRSLGNPTAPQDFRYDGFKVWGDFRVRNVRIGQVSFVGRVS